MELNIHMSQSSVVSSLYNGLESIFYRFILFRQTQILHIIHINHVKIFDGSRSVVVAVVPRAFNVPPEIARLAAIMIEYQIFIAEYYEFINFIGFIRKCGMMDIQICKFIVTIHKIFQTLAFGSASCEILDDSSWLFYVAIRSK